MRKPFYWKARQGWYVKTGDGSQVFLSAEEEEAYDIWKEMRAADGLGSAAVPFALIADSYIEHAKRALAPKTFRGHQDFLVSACASFGAVRVADLKRHHLTTWLDDNPTWKSDWSRRAAVAAVKRALNWAIDEGYLKVSPLAKVEFPKGGRREVLISDDDHRRMVLAEDGGRQPGARVGELGRKPIRRDLCFRPVLIALRHSGTRPGMVAAVTVDNVSSHLDAWVFKDHKTRKKTGKPLIVRLSPCLQTLTRIAMASRKSGPLFRNSKGQPWKSDAIQRRIAKLQKKLGLPPGTVAYAYRHTWTTSAIVNGVDIATVATMLGHKDLRMLMEHYAHLEQQPEHLKEAAAKAVRRSG
jgi:integrase